MQTTMTIPCESDSLFRRPSFPFLNAGHICLGCWYPIRFTSIWHSRAVRPLSLFMHATHSSGASHSNAFLFHEPSRGLQRKLKRVLRIRWPLVAVCATSATLSFVGRSKAGLREIKKKKNVIRQMFSAANCRSKGFVLELFDCLGPSSARRKLARAYWRTREHSFTHAHSPASHCSHSHAQRYKILRHQQKRWWTTERRETIIWITISAFKYEKTLN